MVGGGCLGERRCYGGRLKYLYKKGTESEAKQKRDSRNDVKVCVLVVGSTREDKRIGESERRGRIENGEEMS